MFRFIPSRKLSRKFKQLTWTWTLIQRFAFTLFFPDYCVVKPRLIIIICSVLVDAVRGEVKRGPCGNYCRRTSTHYKTADCNGNVSHLNRAVKRPRMSCNCSEKLVNWDEFFLAPTYLNRCLVASFTLVFRNKTVVFKI